MAKRKPKNMTVQRLWKMLGEFMNRGGNGATLVCINKRTFKHPLEMDGVCVLEVVDGGARRIEMADGDGFTATRADGTTISRLRFILNGDSEYVPQNDPSRWAEATGYDP